MSSLLYSTRWIVIGRASRPVVGCSYVGVFPGVFPYGRHPHFGISIPLSLLMLLGWRGIWIASLNRRVCPWGSLSLHLTSFQLGPCPVELACSATAEVWQRARRTSLSCSFILSCTGLPLFPMYTASHSPHGILYTTPSRLPRGTGSFGRTRWLDRVLSDWKTLRMPCCSRQRRSVCETLST